MPLFTNVDDLMTSWERLKTEAGSATKSPTIQVSESANEALLAPFDASGSLETRLRLPGTQKVVSRFVI